MQHVAHRAHTCPAVAADQGHSLTPYAPHENSVFPTIANTVGSTPLVRLQRLGLHVGMNNVVLLKLEGNNPAGSVKDRPALSMINQAEQSGTLHPGDTLIEATSGNTGLCYPFVHSLGAGSQAWLWRTLMGVK